MLPFLPSRNESSTARRNLLYGFAIALSVLFLVPLTQLVRPHGDKVESIKSVDFSAPPPPPTLSAPPPPAPKELTATPELKMRSPKLTLNQLNLSLNPGFGDLSISTGLGLNIDFSTESVDQLEKLFDFGELDEIPHLIREGRFRYPSNAPTGRGEAYVRLLVYVDKDGQVTARDVIEYSHEELIRAVREMAEDSRFSSPTRNGRAVRSKYEWTIRIPMR